MIGSAPWDRIPVSLTTPVRHRDALPSSMCVYIYAYSWIQILAIHPAASVQIHHGSNVARMPAGSFLHRTALPHSAGPKPGPDGYGILGVAKHGDGTGGHVAVIGDSNCLDSSHQQTNCFPFLLKLLERVIKVGLIKLGGAFESTASPSSDPQNSGGSSADLDVIILHPRCQS